MRLNGEQRENFVTSDFRNLTHIQSKFRDSNTSTQVHLDLLVRLVVDLESLASYAS